jgi:hypothetical protein
LATLSGLFVATANAATPNDGSILPFPTPPSASKAGQTLQESVMKRRVEPNHLSETFDVGVDLGSPVSRDYLDRRPFKFDGKITKIAVQLN